MPEVQESPHLARLRQRPRSDYPEWEVSAPPVALVQGAQRHTLLSIPILRRLRLRHRPKGRALGAKSTGESKGSGVPVRAATGEGRVGTSVTSPSSSDCNGESVHDQSEPASVDSSSVSASAA